MIRNYSFFFLFEDSCLLCFQTLQEEPDAPFTEEDYRRRRTHPNYKAHLTAEKLVIKLGKTVNDFHMSINSSTESDLVSTGDSNNAGSTSILDKKKGSYWSHELGVGWSLHTESWCQQCLYMHCCRTSPSF